MHRRTIALAAIAAGVLFANPGDAQVFLSTPIYADPNAVAYTRNNLGICSARDFGAGFAPTDSPSISACMADTLGRLSLIPPSVAASAATWTNTNKLPVLDLRPTVSASFLKFDTIGTPMLYLRRRNISPAVSGAGVINGWYDPAFRLDWESDSGNATGSHGGLFVYSKNVNGKEWTTVTQSITLNASPQSVTVADSSIFSVGDVAMIDVGKGAAVTEFPTITAVTDATHITAIFSHNHSSGAPITVSGKGDKIGLALLMTEAAGNTSNLTGNNTNTIATAQTGTHSVNGWENDITSNVTPGLWLGDGNPIVYGFTNLVFGTGDATAGGVISSGNGGVSSFKTGLLLQARNEALWINNNINSAAAPDTGIRISSAKTTGLIIGSNQSTPHPQEINVNPSAAGILLTARDITGSIDSNKLRLQHLTTGAAHTWDIYSSTGGAALRFDFDGAFSNVGIDTDGGVSTVTGFRVRDSGTYTERGRFFTSGTTSLITSDVFQTNGAVAGSGNVRLLSAGTINFRNNANSADINGVSKDPSDRVIVGGAAGVILNAGGAITGARFSQNAWSPGTVAAASCATTTFSIAGVVTTGAPVAVINPISTMPAPLHVYAYVSAANTVTAVICNGSAAGVAAGSLTFNTLVFQN
jgi:hypothetical protein